MGIQINFAKQQKLYQVLKAKYSHSPSILVKLPWRVDRGAQQKILKITLKGAKILRKS